MIASQIDKVVLVHLSDRRYDFAVDRFELLVQRCGIKVRSDGFIEKIVADDYRIVSITVCNFPPQAGGQILTLAAFEKERVGPTVIDVVAGLSTGRGVHIQNYVEPFSPAPIDNSVQQFIARALQSWDSCVRYKQTITERDTNRVEARPLDEADIVSRDV